MYCIDDEEEAEVGEEQEGDADRAGGEVRAREQPHVEQRMRAPQFDDREQQGQCDARGHASPHDGVGPPANGSLDHAEHEDRDGAADEHGADPVDRGGGFVP